MEVAFLLKALAFETSPLAQNLQSSSLWWVSIFSETSHSPREADLK